MTWKRLGRVFCPESRFDWMASHAANPFAESVDGSLYRIYFSCRDSVRRSSVGSLLYDLEKMSVVDIDSDPVIRIGERGAFDDSGVSLGCIVSDGSSRHLYYVGWNLAVTVPFRNSIGLAVSRSGGAFAKFQPVPVLDRSRWDPFSLSYPWVLKNDGIWKMWYGSTSRWRPDGSEQDHAIKYAESRDGIVWEPTGRVCLSGVSEESYALSRPCVVLERGVYKMWFSYRGVHYRIGYAESADGIRWERLAQEFGLDPSGEGWDSDAVEYAHVFDHDGARFMLYCGNGYGRTGFGLALWQ